MTNNSKLWFKRKYYGWGWQPASKEGWIVLLIYLILVILISLQQNNITSEFDVILRIVIPSVLLTIGLIFICYKKGEKPKWQWGRRE